MEIYFHFLKLNTCFLPYIEKKLAHGDKVANDIKILFSDYFDITAFEDVIF